jgi:hypothetical protein
MPESIVSPQSGTKNFASDGKNKNLLFAHAVNLAVTMTKILAWHLIEQKYDIWKFRFLPIDFDLFGLLEWKNAQQIGKGGGQVVISANDGRV